MKKIYKVIFVICIIISVYLAAYNVSAGEIFSQANGFIEKGSNRDGSLTDLFGELGRYMGKTEFANVIGILWGLGLLMIFITTVVLGIRYMLVDPNEKSRIKQATTPYIIGVVIIFGAVTIWKLIIQILEG